MDILSLNQALDKLNNVTIPKLDALLIRFEDDAIKDFFGNVNKLLDRLGVHNPETDQTILAELADIKLDLKKLAGIK